MSYTASYIVNSSSAQGTTDFQFTFPYIKEEHIEVYLNYSKITQGSGSAQYQVITNVSPKLVRLNTGIASANLRVEVRRNSSLGSPLVDYADGSTLTANDLDTSALQSLYIDQELKDNQGKTVSVDEATGLPTLNNLRLTNVGDPTSAQDAATKNYVDTTAEPKSAKLTELATMAQNTANALADLTATEVQAIDGLTASTDELNKLDGVTATTAELNYVDGVTSNIQTQLDAKQPLDAELTELATMGSTTASALADLTQAEVQILDGATVTTTELNILDGVTATTTELNYVDGVTSNVQTQLDAKQPLNSKLTELSNDLTATTAELNKLDGVTATTDELNKTDGLLATPAELNTLDGITTNTSELNKLDGVTASTAELNIVAGKSFKTSSGTLDTTSDTEIPSSKVIAAHVASSQTAIGGFTTIADEVSFPNTQPGTGVVVSINNAAGVVVNGSGVSTSGKRVDNTTVTINGFPSSLNGETLAAGVGLIVVSTSTANTYSYHKILSSETDVKQLSDDINDFNSRYRIASSAPGSNNDEGDLYFDTAANKMKVYNGSAWDDVASVGSFFVNTLSSSSATGGGSATFNGSAYRFTLSNAGTSAQQHIVSVNGVVQKPNAGTSQPSEGFAISSNDIIFAAAPASGSDFFIITCGSSVSIGTPSANSVNSSHIIDGSIVDGDISSTANIAGSKVADDSIPEAKLDIHQAPSDGKFLKYTSSNGMEWGDVPAGVGGANGVDFNDNIKARYGAGYDLSIWSDGSVGILQGISGGGIHIGDADTENIIDVEPSQVVFNKNLVSQDNDIDIRKSGASRLLWDDSDTAFEFANDVKLTFGGSAGSSGQVLTSGGASASPSWTTISSSPETTAVASGTLPNGTAVILNSDGTVSKAGLADPVMGSAVTPKVTSCNDFHVVWFNTDLIGLVYRGGGGDIEVIGATISNHTLSFGTASTHSTSVSNIEVAMHEDNAWGKRCGIVWKNGSYYKFSWFVVNANKTITWSQDDTHVWQDEGLSYVAIAPAGQAGGAIWYVSYVRNGDGNIYCQSHATSSNGNSTVSSRANMCSQGRNPCMAGVPGGSSKPALLVYTKYADGDLYARIVESASGAGNTPSGGTELKLYTGQVAENSGIFKRYIDVKWDPTNHGTYSIFGVAFRDTSSHKLYFRLIKIAANATALSTFDSSTNHEVVADKAQDIYVSFDRETRSGFTPQVHIGYYDTDDGDKGKLQTASFNGTTVGSWTETVFQTADMNTAGGDTLIAIGPTGSTGDIVILYKDPTSGGDGSDSFRAKVRTGSASNIQANNVLGFTKAAYTNGQTATISVTGSVSENQSSLTTGSAYYIKQDGTLGTSAESPRVGVDGIALSATKLLIKF